MKMLWLEWRIARLKVRIRRLSFAAKFGIAFTTFWLIGAVLYLFAYQGWQHFKSLPANSLGDFLAGVAAPIAFLWLILGFFQQGAELGLQRRELRLQREQLRLQREEVARLAGAAGKQAASADAAVFLTIFEFMQREEVRDARTFVRTDLSARNYDDWKSELDTRKTASLVCSTLDVVGIFLRNELVAPNLVRAFLHSAESTIIACYEATAPLIREFQSKSGEQFWEGFDWLYCVCKTEDFGRH